MKIKVLYLLLLLSILPSMTYAQYYSGRVGETISLPNPAIPAGYHGILESRYLSDSKYLSVYPGTSSVKILSYFSSTETVRCDFTCYREYYSAGRLYFDYGTASAYFYITCSSPDPGLVLSASPDGGQIGIGQTIKLKVTYNGSDISGCDIYYTLNGSTPSKSSTHYNSGIAIDGNCTLKAIAYKDGYKTSDVLTVKYTVVDITLTADPAGGNVTKGTVVHLYSNKSNASIRYTLNGSTPTIGDPIYKPTEGIVINQSCTLKATAKINGKNNSIISTPVMEWKFTISSGKLVLTATPSGGQVSKGSVVKLATKAEGTTVSSDIYYTLNGTTPSKSSTKYSSSGISINSDCTLKAIAYKNGYETSNILTSNYTIKDDLTLTANSYTRVYGDDNPTFDYTVSGGTITSGEPAITCSATNTSPVGIYDIVISKGTVGNSNVNLVKGTLTITPAPLNVIAGNYTRQEGEENPAFILTYNGFKNGENEDVLTEKPTITTTATEDSDPGDYPVTVSGGCAINYALSYENGTLSVTKRSDDVTLTANSYTRVYGDDNPAFEYTVSSGTVTSGDPAITCSATNTSPVGIYDIVINKGSVGNSNVKLVKGTLTITPAPLNVIAGNYTRQEGEENPTFTPTYNGFKNSENKDVLTEEPTVTTTATEDSDPGDYPVTVSGGSAKNYALTYENGTLTVTKRSDDVTLTANSYTRVYGDDNPAFEYTVSSGTVTSGEPAITCSATNTSSVGTYDIVISKGTVSNSDVKLVKGTLTITPAPLNVIAGNYTRQEGEENPTFTLTYNGFKNGENEDVLTEKPTITTTATKDSTPGDYPVTASGGSAKNYALSYENGTLTVTKRSDDVTLTANSYTRVYGDDNPAFEYTVSSGTVTSGDPAITCSATNTSPVGTYDIVISKGTVSNSDVKLVKGTLTITPAPLNVIAGNYTRQEREENPAFILTYNGFKNGENEDVLTEKPTITTTATEDSDPGDYPVTVSGGCAKNYALSYENGTLTVTKRSDDVTLTANSYTRVYGDDNPAFEYTVSSGTVTSGKPAITCSATNTSSVGIYDIIISKGSVSNSAVQFVNGNLSVTAAPLTISAGNYTMRQGEPMPQFAATYSGFRNNEGEKVLSIKPQFACEANENSAPGTYKISVSGAEAKNYAIEYVSGTLTILSAVNTDEMTISTTTAGSLSTEIGNSMWKTIRSLTISGQINGTDIRLIHKMLKEGKLEELNLRDAKIVSGGDSYDFYGLYNTSENAIGESMFYNCRNLKKIILPSSTRRINSYAFFGCSGLKQIELPKACITVGDYAIAFCDSLTSVTIPAGIMRIGESAFTYCTSLSTIYSEVDDMNEIVSSDYYFSPFDGIADDCLWHVPTGTKDNYTTLSWWDGSWGVIDDIDLSTAIEKVTVNQAEEDVWYTLRGTKSNVKPTIPGIYLYRGKKVVIR